MQEKDNSTYEGCMELVEKIRRFWARQGKFPNVWTEKLSTLVSTTAQPKVTYTVASDMVGGRPL